MTYKQVFLSAAMAAVIILLGTAMPGSAAVVDTTITRDYFASATTVDFESLNLTQGTYAAYYAAGLNADGVNFTFVNGGTNELRAMFPNPGDPTNFGTGHVIKGHGVAVGSYLLALLSEPTTAFGVDLGVTGFTTRTFRVSLDGQILESAIAATLKPNFTFFGVSSDTPFTQVKIFLSGSVASDVHPILDNFSHMNEAPPIENPEVTTVLYVATGVALLALRYRRRGSV